MTKYICDICGRKCGNHVNYSAFVPFVIQGKAVKVGYHCGFPDEHDYPDFCVWLKVESKTLSEHHICKKCAQKMNRLISEELRNK
jgi:hypothetical protein